MKKLTSEASSAERAGSDQGSMPGCDGKDREWTVDKSKLPPGPWKDEADRVEFEWQGIACVVVRPHGDIGSLCGYVGVPPGHPWHGRGYEEIDARAHGGLTYCDAARWPVCHGDADPRWWVGFDCVHLGDLSPGLRHRYGDEVYRDLHWVREETICLAAQALAAAKGATP